MVLEIRNRFFDRIILLKRFESSLTSEAGLVHVVVVLVPEVVVVLVTEIFGFLVTKIPGNLTVEIARVIKAGRVLVPEIDGTLVPEILEILSHFFRDGLRLHLKVRFKGPKILRKRGFGMKLLGTFSDFTVSSPETEIFW